MRSRYALVATLPYSVSLLAQNHNPTLGQALRQHHIPTTGVAPASLKKTITSFAKLNDPRFFVIGYYDEHGALLSPPLWVSVYDKQHKTWRSRAIRNVQAAVIGNMQADCLGSILAIRVIGGHYVLDTHLNPSAGCVLVLDSQLRLKRALSGWVVASFSSGDMLIEHSTVHFAPTHPLQLDIYNPNNDNFQQIFPPKRDPLRDDYMADLRGNLSEDYCQEANASCNPETFEIHAASFEVNDKSLSFAFVAEFEPIGFGPKAEEVVGDRGVLYVYRLRQGTWEYRELVANGHATQARDAILPSAIEAVFDSHP